MADEVTVGVYLHIMAPDSDQQNMPMVCTWCIYDGFLMLANGSWVSWLGELQGFFILVLNQLQATRSTMNMTMMNKSLLRIIIIDTNYHIANRYSQLD